MEERDVRLVSTVHARSFPIASLSSAETPHVGCCTNGRDVRANLSDVRRSLFRDEPHRLFMNIRRRSLRMDDAEVRFHNTRMLLAAEESAHLGDKRWHQHPPEWY